MSPRSKDNLINKIKIEHMLWRTDLAFDKKDVEHKIVEKTEEDNLVKKTNSIYVPKHAPPPMYKSYFNSHVDKIAIL
jgi:alpha-galactosidase/6-phospho-beta-glucosidase family protein